MKIPFLSSLLRPKRHEAGWFAVGLGAQGVYLAKVEFAGGMPRVARCEYLETGTVSVGALEKLRREANLGSHDCTTLLGLDEYQIMLVDAPNVPTDELKTAVRWKIKDSLNYHIDDATVDVLQIPASKYGSERVQSIYAIAASNDIIKKRINLFERAKIALDVIDIPETAQRNIAALFEQDDRALVLLVFNDNGGLLTFTSGGELFLSRRIDISAGQLCDADESSREQFRDRVELELQRSLDYFDRQFNHMAISRLLVSAPDEALLVEFLASVSDAKVEKLDLSQVMDISAVPELADSGFVADALLTLGAALRQEKRTL